MNKKITHILTILLLITATANSQTYPVVSTSQIIPPYSVYLSDYAGPSSDKLVANLYLQDQNQSGLQVKLKITITGDNGVKLETKPEFMPPPITMYSGAPEQISGFALQEYLEPANLNITGLNVSQFMQNKKLPEGIYQFTVQAVEYRRNKVVSNPGTAVGWLILNDPPIWNLPQQNSTVTATNPQNIFFSWFPMHSGSPNSAFTTEYEFSLYDLIPQTANPDEYVNIGVPIHQSTTMSNSLVYGPVDVPLEPGRKYACRLRAYDTEGRDMFKNNGYSTVLVFTYGQECITPVGINHDNVTPNTANVHWTSIPGNTEFEVHYREKTDDNSSPWYSGSTYQTAVEISQLKPEYTYEYKIMAYCGTIESEYSDLYEFTTPEKITDTISCGDNSNIPEIDGSPPLQELLFGDVINVGGFEGIITQARGGNGVFTGKCIMRLTTFNILLKSHFTDISINQSYQVTAGTVVADRGPGIMINLDDITEELDSLANLEPDSIIDDPGSYLEDLEIVYDIDPVLINDSIAEDLQEIYEDLQEIYGSGELTDEQLQAIENLLEQIENLLNQGNQSNDRPSFVMFKAHPEQQYGFDEPDSIISLQQYYQPPNTINGKEQLIRWKSIKANGGTDKVFARLDSVNTNIKFYNGAGTEITPQNAHVDTLKIINLQGGISGTTEIITAKIEENDSTSIEAGMLNLISYEQINKNLVIVPVNGNTLPDGMTLMQFADSLNKTYGQAVVHWNVEDLHDSIDFDYAEADQTENFNAWPEQNVPYTPDMQALINEFMSGDNFDPEKYYVFLVSDPENPVQLGIMPFFQNFAFVFADKANQAQTFAKTTGHELGHGAFGLEHPFKRHDGIEEFTSENLMNYHPTASFLNKYQWDLIHNPVCWADGDCGTGGAPLLLNTKEFHLNNFVRTLKLIRCAKNKNERYVYIYNDLNDIRVTFGDLTEKIFGERIETYENAEIRLFVADNTTRTFEYYEDNYDLNSVYFNNNTHNITIPGNEGYNIVIGPTIENETIYNFLKRFFNENINLTPSATVAGNMSKDGLQWESICTYELINDDRRLLLLADFSNSSVNKKKEKIIINLAKTIQNKDYVYNHIKQNPQFLKSLYNKISTSARDELMNVIIELWNNNYNNDLSAVKSDAQYSYIITNSIFGNATNRLYFSDQGEIIFTIEKITILENGDPHSDYPEIFRANPFKPIYMGFRDDADIPFTILPAICIKHYVDKGNRENMKEALMLTVNIALFAVGVGEIVAGVRGFTILARATGITATEIIGSTLRVTLGVLDLAAFSTSAFYCNGSNSNTEFCKDWKEFELYVDMGLLTASVTDMLITKLSRSYTPDVKANLNNKQIDVIENKLGIPVSNLDNLAGLFPRLANKEDALIKLDNILNSGRITQQKLVDAVNGNLGDILTNANDINLGKILDRLNLGHVNDAHFDKITERLSNYSTLKQDLFNHPDWFETFDDILDNPGKYWDILNEGNIPSGTALSSWGQGFWWKNLRDLADEFENGAAYVKFKQVTGITNDQKIVSQVTLEVNGTKVRIDYLGIDSNGKFHLGDAKFSTKDKDWINNWLDAATNNQTTVFPLFQSNGVNSIVVKATDQTKLAQLQQRLSLTNNSTIDFSNTSLKIFGSNPNQQSIKKVVTIKN